MEEDEPADADALAAAIDYIEQYGWHQGQLFANFGACGSPACGLGAVVATTLGSDPSPADYAQKARLYKALDIAAGGCFPAFNDLPTTTKEDVINLMSNVLCDLRLKEQANGED